MKLIKKVAKDCIKKAKFFFSFAAEEVGKNTDTIDKTIKLGWPEVRFTSEPFMLAPSSYFCANVNTNFHSFFISDHSTTGKIPILGLFSQPCIF